MRCLSTFAYRLLGQGGEGPEAYKLEGGFHNGAYQHQCPPGRISSPNGCHQCLCPQGELQLPPTPLGDSPDQQVRLTQAPITASTLDPGACESLCAPFKSTVSTSHSSLGLWRVSPAGLQSQMLWGLVFPVYDPQVMEPNMGSDPSLLGEDLCNGNYPPVCALSTQGYGI